MKHEYNSPTNPHFEGEEPVDILVTGTTGNERINEHKEEMPFAISFSDGSMREVWAGDKTWWDGQRVLPPHYEVIMSKDGIWERHKIKNALTTFMIGPEIELIDNMHNTFEKMWANEWEVVDKVVSGRMLLVFWAK